MYAGSNNSIEWAKNRPVFARRNFSDRKMKEISKLFDPLLKESNNIDEHAALYYLSSHTFHLIESQAQSPASPLGLEQSKFTEEHISRLNKLSLRMFAYLCIISAEEACFGEARNDSLWDFIETSTSPDAGKWVKNLVDRSGGYSSRGNYFSGCGEATVGECLKAVEMVFRFARWSPGFGGLPWAQITQTAIEICSGINSLELGVDKAFTLCHNNGAIFNKGHIFSHYSGGFYRLLDIQASGQIPAAIHSKVSVEGLKHASVRALFEEGKKMFPAEFSAGYDESRVKNMESVRRAKEQAAAKKAASFISGGGGWGQAGQNAAPQPPKRACDDIVTLDDLENIHKSCKGGFNF